MNHIFKCENQYYLINTNSMKLYKISYENYDQLELLAESDLDELAQKFEKGEQTKVKRNIVSFDEKKCNRLIINMAESCNLACKYCYAQEGSYGQKERERLISIDIVKKSVVRVLELYPKGITSIQFFGGEPLLNKNTLRQSVIWINDYIQKLGLELPKYMMVTNGTLIEDEDIEFFNNYFTSITISLDGEKKVNDCKRVFKGKDISVFDVVKEKIHKMNKIDRKFLIAIEGTINEEHIKEYISKKNIASFDALHSLGVDLIHISPEIKSNYEYSTDEICDFFGSWVAKEVTSGTAKMRLRAVMDILIAIKNNTVYGNGCGATNTDLALNVHGDLYPCFMFIGHDEFHLGNVVTPLEVQKDRLEEIRNKLRLANENDSCQKCWVKPICSKSYGHCIGARFLSTYKIDEPNKVLCSISKTVLERIFVEANKIYGVNVKRGEMNEH